MSSQVFGHSGDLGDIIYSLPAIRGAGGGKLILFDSPGKTSHGMSEAKANRLKPLLEAQEYIEAVEWSEEPHEHNLNGFRDHHGQGHLADMHLATLGLCWKERAKQWLHVDPIVKAEVVMHRTFRYRHDRFPWGDAVELYGSRAAFIGLEHEHVDFCDRFGYVPRLVIDNFLVMAQVIAGSKLFIGSMSSPLAIAQGLKHRIVFEVCPNNHRLCIVQSMNCIGGWDERIEWPEI